MPWSTAEVAAAAGVPATTLLAWARSGLLPGRVADDTGARWYVHDDLLRLQRILLLRAGGLDDDVVRAVLAADGTGAADGTAAADRAALADHRDALTGLAARCTRRAAALTATLDGRATDPAAMFDGFGPTDEAGTPEIPDDLVAAWVRAYAAGTAVDGAAARELTARHRACTDDRDALPPAWAATLDRHAPGTAAYARDALAAHPDRAPGSAVSPRRR